MTSSTLPKVAIITGASRGIGLGIASAFRAAGYAVVANALAIEPSQDPELVAVSGDITETETAELVVTNALDRFGRIDTLVNNAGLYIGKPFTEYTVDDYVAITDVNLKGFFHITQRAIPSNGAAAERTHRQHLDEPCRPRRQHQTVRPGGAHQGWPRRRHPSLAIEYASSGVRVNAVSLGVIRTPAHDPASYDSLGNLHPLGHVGDVADVAEGILYLERAPFVTGEILHIDGGQSAGR